SASPLAQQPEASHILKRPASLAARAPADPCGRPGNTHSEVARRLCTAKPLHKRCGHPQLPVPGMASASETCSITRRISRSYYLICAKGRNGPARGSAYTASPAWETLKDDDDRPPPGSGQRVAARYALAQSLPARRRLAHAAQGRAALPAAR